jgi:uncharacterized protein YecE (DUF72 family)
MMSGNTGIYYSGMSGLELPIPKYNYPEIYQSFTRLQYYATLFNSIEINSSFYKIPRAVTIAKWITTLPESFTFTFKLWKEITHAKQLNFKDEDVKKFLDALTPAPDRSCLLIQFPPGLSSEWMLQLDNLLHVIRNHTAMHRFRLALELRHASWYANHDINTLAERHDATVVLHDKARYASPFFDQKSGFMYVRFHGPAGNYRGSYSEDFLEEYASYIIEWLTAGKAVFVYFNNTMGDAYNNLQTLNKLVRTLNGTLQR